MLPTKRPKIRSGIERAPKREFPRHRAFVRRHRCIVTLGIIHDDCDGPIECSHVRLGAPNNGISIKPHDAYSTPACRKHHAEIHRIGEASFAKKYTLNLLNLAREFAIKSPVEEVREAARHMDKTQ